MSLLGGVANRSASMIWSSLSAAARCAADRGWVASARLGARVVSVGNIQAGGAGKTPLVATIAREAHARGLRAVILCRGYGGAWERSGGVLPPRAADGEGAAAPRCADCGDEAALLRDLAPHAWIGVGADRARQFERVRAQAGGVDLVVLDDGFQHYRIRKDVEIVALTSASPATMPHRDWVSSLRRAHLVVWTKGDDRPRGMGQAGASARVRYRLAPAPAGFGPVWLVSGVGDSRSVERLSLESGYEVLRHVSFPDHARYAQPMVKELVDGAARAGARLAVTGKDWVKWREMDLGSSAPSLAKVVVLEPEIEWLEGKDRWNRALWGS